MPSMTSSLRRALLRVGNLFSKEQVRPRLNKKVILDEESSFQVKEAYKVLRTNIVFSLPHEGCKRVIITSALPSEGKSTTSLNLAITFAETGAKVLLIDADLRRPNIAPLLNVQATPGLSNALVKLVKLDDVVRKSAYQNLDVILSGDIPPNPAELLDSEAMGNMLDYFSERYDYIFLDTCPVNLVADTSILSKYVSGIVVVAQCNQSEKDDVREALRQLKFVGGKIIGGVLNQMDSSGKVYRKYGKRGYYQQGYYY